MKFKCHRTCSFRLTETTSTRDRRVSNRIRLQDDSERPIAFASRSLSKSEKNYSQIDKEATAIYWDHKKIFHYCYRRKFILVSDHKPLTTIFHPYKTLPTMSTMRLFHYAHFLSGFDCTIEHRTSLNNGNSDYLSRFPI